MTVFFFTFVSTIYLYKYKMDIYILLFGFFQGKLDEATVKLNE